MKLLPKRPTIWALMLLVAVVACLVGWFRPITQSGAVRTADRYFHTLPGASRWDGSYRVNAWPSYSTNYGDGWTVDFYNTVDGEHLAQMNVTAKGMLFGVGVDLDKLNKPKLREAPGR